MTAQILAPSRSRRPPAVAEISKRLCDAFKEHMTATAPGLIGIDFIQVTLTRGRGAYGYVLGCILEVFCFFGILEVSPSFFSLGVFLSFCLSFEFRFLSLSLFSLFLPFPLLLTVSLAPLSL